MRRALRSLLALATAAAAQDITVNPGDTLWSLAQRHDTSVDALVSWLADQRGAA